MPWGLVLAVVLAYANSLTLPFVFDDVTAVTRNASIRSLATAFGQPEERGGATTNRPVANATLALNYALSGETPWSYRATNLLIHAAAGLALFGVVRRTLRQPVFGDKWGSHADSVAFAASLLWAVHPLQTATVLAVAQRTESLCSLLILVMLYSHLRAIGSAHPRRWQTVTVLACLLGMGTKEVMVVAPVLLVLFDRTFLAGSFAQAWRQRGPVFIACFATWTWLAVLVLGSGGTRGQAAGLGLGVEWWQYALKQAEAIVLYLRLALVPWPLVADYGTAVAHAAAEVWGELLIVLGLVTATAWALWRRPGAGFLGAAFFLILAPSSSVIPLVAQTVGEHRMYLPLAAFTVSAALGLHRGLGAKTVAAALALAVIGMGLTAVRARDYRSELGLWQDTAAKVPENMRAHYNVGSVLLEQGRAAEALVHFERALRLQPDDAGVLLNYGNALLAVGRVADAEAAVRRALAGQPQFAVALLNLGRILIAASRWDEAQSTLERALALQPDLAEAHANLGGIHLQAGRAEAARAASATALRHNPELTIARRNLGMALLGLGRLEEGVAELERVRRVQPDDFIAHRGLAWGYARLGRTADALRHVDAMLAQDPTNPEALQLSRQLRGRR